jgi:hypothetical protein
MGGGVSKEIAIGNITHANTTIEITPIHRIGEESFFLWTFLNCIIY